MLRFTRILALFIPVSLIACGHASVQELYSDLDPEFNPSTFFDGELAAYGIVKNRGGKVIRRFKADIIGEWEGNNGTLDETFYFDDGEVSKRFWELEMDASTKTLNGKAGDVIGQAIGSYAGPTLHWKYTLRIPYKEKTIDVAIDDWLYLINDNKLINESVLRKFGFKVGEITLVIEKK